LFGITLSDVPWQSGQGGPNLSRTGHPFGLTSAGIYKGVYLMTKSSGEFIVLNISDTEEQANSWPQNPKHQEVVTQLRQFLSGAPVREGFQVQARAVA